MHRSRSAARPRPTRATARADTAGREPVSVETIITGLGHAGDGIAAIDGRALFVPFALPGDHVRIDIDGGPRARLRAVLAPGPDRVVPICRHFGLCGGCALQHLEPAVYRRFTRDQVIAALRQRGFADPPVRDTFVVAPGTRRRAALSAARLPDGRVRLGFAERGSHRLVDLEHCPVLVPALEALIAPLRDWTGAHLRRGEQAKLVLTATATGVELALRLARPPALPDREDLAQFSTAHRLARVVWNDEMLIAREQPTVDFGGVPVALPPAPFLQATEAGEQAMVAIAAAAVGGSARVADLFAGCGAFALPLSARARIDAFDSDAAAIEALGRAAARAQRPVVSERRDLFRRPLEPAELNRYDAVVIDPPHAGARAQAERLAGARVPVVVMASCHPATFARDARILADGGYRLEAVTPIDQFLWSAEVELIAVFRKDRVGGDR